MSNPITKVIIGIVLIFGSVWWGYTGSAQYISRSWLTDFIATANAIIPALVFLIGIFIVWLELDEIKIEAELKREEKKPKRKR